MLLVQSISNLYLPRLNAELINNGVAKGNLRYIWHMGFIMVGTSLIVIVASIFISYTASRIANNVARDIRKDVFTSVENFSTRELNKFGAPSLITRNTNDVSQIQMLVNMGLTMMIGAPITGIGAVIMALRTDVQLSGLLLVAVPTMSLIIWALLHRIVPLFRISQIRLDRINLVLREQIAGIRVIRAFVKTRYEEERFAEASRELTEVNLATTRTFAIMFPSLMMVMNLSSAAVIWFGAHLINKGQMEIGNLIAFINYITQILMSVMMAVMMSMFIPRAQASAERIQEVLQTESSVIDPENPIEPEIRSGVIEFKGVEFRYPGAEQAVLQNISFTAMPGKVTAIVGSTGSGKSTLLNLIPRLIDATSGEVLLDGVDVQSQSLESVWSQMGYVPQRAFLFGGDVESNIKFGAPEAEDAAVWEALEVAQAIDFVKEKEGALKASVSQGGSNFSGGQKQRLSIARALVKKPHIYLFDDSFSALDYATDSKLRKALGKYAEDATVIIVAQRVSTILKADQIIVLNEGRIEGIGTHKQLMKSCKTYQEIVLSQISPEEA